jgi:hypothetical protein
LSTIMHPGRTDVNATRQMDNADFLQQTRRQRMFRRAA